MLINGKQAVRERGEVRLPRSAGDLTIPIQAVGPRFEIEVNRDLPEPSPPVVHARDKDGNPARGKDGAPIVTEKTKDPNYLAKVSEVRVLIMVAYIYEGTIQGDAISWETPAEERSADPRGFYLRILDELQEAGISQGEMVKWWLAIRELSGMKIEEVEEAERSFPGD